jgi:hypothetical protein
MLELPENVAMRDYARLNIGETTNGLQVWCVRHDINVGALNFGGQKIAFEDERPRAKTELNKLRVTLHTVRARYVENMRAGKFVDDGVLAKFDEQLRRLEARPKTSFRASRASGVEPSAKHAVLPLAGDA